MNIAIMHEHYDENHLEKVKAEMKQLGAPTIKAVWMECYGHWAALEGCHRIRAAKALGLEPEIEEIEYSEDTLEDVGCDGREYVTVSDIADSSFSSTIFEF